MPDAMHWKIQRDPYLAALWARHGEAAVWAAGFFFDDDDEDAPLDDVDWLCTPRPKREVCGPSPAVLLSTGGFCPIHKGHLAMMERAKLAAERAGWNVIGGYFSPGHDAYLQKKCGAAAMPAHERLRLCAEAVRTSDWLSVDPWESMHRRVSVNFTDVAARLRAYLRTHVDPRIEVLYVCGGDNARFAQAFTERGGCIVVARPGASAEYAHWRARLGKHPRVLWTDGTHARSSRDLRAAVWSAPPKRDLVLRCEDEHAVRSLGFDRARFAAFQRQLVSLLAPYVNVRTERMVPASVPVSTLPTISLDAMVPSTYQLAISRLFSLGGYELLGHVRRPGAPPLTEQIACIAPGRYALRDDDSVTGSTLKAARALLPSHVIVDDTHLAIRQRANEDVVDARDFLLGADHGGLVIALPGGGIGRAPYALPYVDPAVRASIPASHKLSTEIWELNACTFARTGLRVRDLPAPTRASFAQFGDSLPLERVCTWHSRNLQRFAGSLPPHE
ncbi:hypothetical protein LZC95_20410 [Pendulispora brunnea]|uniref:Cytidyltransferase-like domain-containing protein n=1 Tax=Pendulispora brunnea TaxID=2905690 RepID=A0ABZ2KPA8_9BACT